MQTHISLSSWVRLDREGVEIGAHYRWIGPEIPKVAAGSVQIHGHMMTDAESSASCPIVPRVYRLATPMTKFRERGTRHDVDEIVAGYWEDDIYPDVWLIVSKRLVC